MRSRRGHGEGQEREGRMRKAAARIPGEGGGRKGHYLSARLHPITRIHFSLIRPGTGLWSWRGQPTTQTEAR